MSSISDIHKEIVKELKDKFGETEIFNPTSKSFLHIGGTPDIYVKGITFPSEEFISGTGYKEKDGTISILQDHLTSYYSGFNINQLGLCDPVVWYENINLLKQPEINEIKCPCCGK